MNRPKMRQCDECRFADMRSEELRCAQGHKPAFVVPGWPEIQSGEWGWMLRCNDFSPTKEPAPIKTTPTEELLAEQARWRKAAR